MNYKNGTYLSAIESLLGSPFEELKRERESLLGSPFEELKRERESLLGSPFEELKRERESLLGSPFEELKRERESLLGSPFEELKRERESLLGSPFEELKRERESLLGSPFEELKRERESLLGSPFEELKRAQDAIVSVREPAVDWQKQLNFLKSPQASLGFPNIIRGELAVDPFRSSTPTQRRTPLFDFPPPESTGEVYEEISTEIIPAPSPELVPITSHGKVFIVHGHDHASRDTVADFVGNWGFTPTVLDKQPSRSRTIIEKFEQCAGEANFAIVLMTPDDVGASGRNRADLKSRARQNVIFELGYFFGSIGRKRVCILYKGDLELPSDIQGVVYVPMDDNGEWKQSIIREMESVGLLIDANKI